MNHRVLSRSCRGTAAPGLRTFSFPTLFSWFNSCLGPALGAALFLLLMVGLAPRAARAADSDWASNFNVPGANSAVRAVVQTSDAIYIGGDFTTIGNVAANRIARYDKTSQTWSALGSGTNGSVQALAINGTDLYVGGTFTTAGGATGRNYIAKWSLGGSNDAAWSALGSGTNSTVLALALNGSDLYVGGLFTTAGGVSGRNNIAKWSLGGSSDAAWSALGSGVNSAVVSLALNGSDLYVGGAFSTAGGVSGRNYIAKWSLGGSSDAAWSALGSGTNSNVQALALNGSDLYVGGAFSTAGGATGRKNIAKWSLGGSSDAAWSGLGSGVGDSVSALALNGSDLYVGGFFTTAGGATGRKNIAKWSLGGSSDAAWSGLGSGVGDSVSALALNGSDLYVGGFFTTAGTNQASRIAKWNGSSFSGLTSGDGMNSAVRAIVDGGSVLYVGGEFTAAGGVPANYVACWNKANQTWSALGSGTNGNVLALALNGTDLYVGGAFTTAGGATGRNYIAKWSLGGSSDTAWSALGSGTNSIVNALALNGSDLYVGGGFTTAGGATGRNYIAKWSLGGSSDTAWSALGSGTNSTVVSLALNGTDLYVGGLFTTAGGATGRNYIAKWSLGGSNDAAWSALGSGTNSTVRALALNGSDLYVGGFFTTAGGAGGRNYIAKWSLGGSSDAAWSALGSGVGSTVQALALSGSDLYVGGQFTTAGGAGGRNYIAKWSLGGSSDAAWSALGSGVGNSVSALALNGSDLYVGGFFTTAGQKASSYIGRYHLNSAPSATVSLSSYSPKTNDLLTATATTNDADGDAVTLTYVWKRGSTTVKTTSNTSSLTDTLNLATAGNGDKGDVITVTVTPKDASSSGAAVSDTATVTNSAPVVKDLELPTRVGSSLLARLEASDADGDTLSFTPQGAVGTFSAVGNKGFFLYTPPAAGAAFDDAFTAQVSDGSDTATANLTLHVASYAAGTPFYSAVGASDVQGYGASDYDATYSGSTYDKVSYSPALAYAPQVASSGKLGATLPGLALSRRAVNGLTLSDALSVGGSNNTIALAAGDGAKAYSIAFGPNDVLYELLPLLLANPANTNTPAVLDGIVTNYLNNWKIGYSSVKTTLAGANPAAKFAAITVPDLGPGLTAAFGGSLNGTQQANLSAALTSACTQMTAHIKATFPSAVDIQGNSDLNLSTDSALVFNPASDLFVDGFHPDDSGYAKLATRLFRALDKQFNHAPSAIGLTPGTVAENSPVGTSSGTLSSTDQDSGDSFTYSLVTGAGDSDNASFVIGNDGVTLKTTASFNYEVKNSYSVRVRSTDAGNLSFEQALTINVSNVNEAPTLAPATLPNAQFALPYNQALSANDPDGDTLNWNVTGGALPLGLGLSNGLIGGMAMEKGTFNFTVTVDDSHGASDSQPYSITVLSPPTVTGFSPNSGTVGTSVDITGTDFTGATSVTFNGTAATSFTVNSATQITAIVPTATTGPIAVTTTGGTGTSSNFTVVYNYAPTDIALSPSSVAENGTRGMSIGTFITTDQNFPESFTYSLVTGQGDTDNALFAIDGNSLTEVNPFDFESQNSYSIRVRSTDSSELSTEKVFTISVTNANDRPTASYSPLALNERTSATITPTDLSAVDEDGDVVTFTVTVAPTQGTLKRDNVALKANDTFTQADIVAGKLSYTHTGAGNDSFGFTYSDGTSSSAPATLDILVTPVPPTVLSVVRAAGAVNPTNANSVQFTVTFSEAVTGVDASDFSVTTTGLTGASVNSVSGSGTTYTVTVSGAKGNGTLRLNVVDNDSIVDGTSNPLSGGFTTGESYNVDTVAPTVTINQGSGQADPSLTPDGSIDFDVQFSESVTGFTNADVQLSGTAGATTAVVTGSGSSYTVTVSGMTGAGTVVASIGAGAASDAAGNQSVASTSTDNTVTYSPQYAPTAIALSKSTVSEKQPVGTFVGAFSSTDANAGNSFTYTLATGTGDEDNGQFEIGGINLRTKASFDAAVKSSYSIRVRSTDNTGLWFEQQFTITVSETTKPVVTISTPSLNAKVLIPNFIAGAVSGTATDNVGVTQVRVRLSRTRNNVNQYWNGTDFVATQATVLADVNGSDWTLSTNVPPMGKLDVGAYALQVSAYDAAGNKSAYADRTFSLWMDSVAPTLSITAPTANQKVVIADFVAGAALGTASDDNGVAAVKVRLSRKEGTTTYYWNGTDFVTTSAVVDADLAGSTSASWKLLAKVPSAEKLTVGAYALAVYALDAAGNKSATASVGFNLSTDYTAPSVSITTPTSSQVIKINELGAGRMTGSASDNIGVTSVKLKLQRKRGTLTTYWNGTNFGETVATFDASYNSETGAWSYDSAIPANALDAGGYTLYATATDAAGNKTTSASRMFSIVGAPSAADAVSVTGKSAGSS